MSTELAAKTSPTPCIEQVLEEIAFYRRVIVQAGPARSAARREARAAYLPFVERRVQLLRALRAGRARRWREYRVPPCASAPARARPRH